MPDLPLQRNRSGSFLKEHGKMSWRKIKVIVSLKESGKDTLPAGKTPAEEKHSPLRLEEYG
jgi:hypothetical protein